jgi:hypothetical protein
MSMLARPVPALSAMVTVPGLPGSWEANFTTPGPEAHFVAPNVDGIGLNDIGAGAQGQRAGASAIVAAGDPHLSVVARIVLAVSDSMTSPGPWVVLPTPMLKLVTLVLNAAIRSHREFLCSNNRHSAAWFTLILIVVPFTAMLPWPVTVSTESVWPVPPAGVVAQGQVPPLRVSCWAAPMLMALGVTELVRTKVAPAKVALEGLGFRTCFHQGEIALEDAAEGGRGGRVDGER